MQNNTQHTEDKIELKELFAILKSYKKLIAGVTVLFILFALTYIYFIAKPVYAVKTMIEVGQIKEKPIGNVNDIQQKLAYEYRINTKEAQIKLPRVVTITVANKSKNIILITIHGHSNKEAVKYIQTVIRKIETDYKEKIVTYTNSQKKLIKLTQEDIKENSINLKKIKKALDAYSQKIISLKSEDAALAGIYALQIGQIGQNQTKLLEIQKYISELKNTEQKLKLSITPLMIKPTHIVGEIVTLENPIKPKKKLIIIIAFITGLMLSIFLIFFLEFLRGSTEEDPE